ncbi:MATE family efflux transporter [[Kitasatospora] papulosa]|uniref:MATE family efflux transporter n=1 Tax=[Kitasatospora] papulosa TaxID=1464011 RepID=UPI0036C2E5B0
MTQAPAATRSSRRRHDREIIALAVPAFGALVAEPLFVMVDSAIVGHLGTPQLAGLGIAAALLMTAVSVFVFLAYATTAAVARRVGAGDLSAAIRQGMDGIWLALLLGVAVVAVVLPAAPWLVDAFGASDTAAPHAITYLRISSFGIPAMLVVMAATGVLRGLQDTRTPLYVAIGGFAANAALNLGLVYGAGLGIAGSAWGTVIAQCAMAAVYLVVVIRGARPLFIPLFTSDPAVKDTLLPALLVVAVTQPIAGVVFVLDGVLMGAGDGPYLAGAMLITLAVFAPIALLVPAFGGGLTALWWAMALMMTVRMATLWLRTRSGRWIVTGATR